MQSVQSQGKEQYWRAHVAVWRRSGQSAAAYCQAQGLSPASLGYWSRKLAQAQLQTQGLPALMPIEVAPAPPSAPLPPATPPQSPAPQSWLQAHFANGIVLHLPASAALLPAVLPTVLRELAAC